MTYQMVPLLMSLSDLQGHLPTASLFKCNILYSCAATDKISADKQPQAIDEHRQLYEVSVDYH